MKASHSVIARLTLLSSALLAAGCVPAPDSTPSPQQTAEPIEQAPAPAPAPTPPPSPSEALAYEDWMDAPRTKGNWSYRPTGGGSVALYGEAQTDARFSIRCDRSVRAITIMRAGKASSAVPMRILTETTERTIEAVPTGGELPYIAARVAARDPLLDAMALTKGRFAVETPDSPTLYLPAWAEVTKVIEDCR